MTTIKTQHTPGPWKATDIDGYEQGFKNRVYSAIGSLVAHVDWYDNGWTPANARLIAAAPELLAALKSGMPWISDHAPTEIWNDAINAIAKAEGRSE